ncbi:MAG TPA: error-prone DNA polymerase [Candidatus Dormibacteraeota bacterium]
MTPFVELRAHTNYSFLQGASFPYELARRAAELEMPALGLTDYGGVYGTVKFVEACKHFGVKPLLGAEIEVDGQPLAMLARTRQGWSNLCRISSHAHQNQPKGEARTTLETVAAHRQDLFFITSPTPHLLHLQEALGRDNVFVELSHHLRAGDDHRLEQALANAQKQRAATIATNVPRYHDRARRPLYDVVTAIRNRASLDDVRALLHPNSELTLKAGDELHPTLRRHDASWEIAQACDVDLNFEDVRFPGFKVPDGETPFSYLYQLSQQGARQRYHPITSKVAHRLQTELEVIEKTGLAEFFLINWDLMSFARENGVPGQGRGSAADSIVAYVLGITRVDPIEHNLLFERFLHEEMKTTPDIDIDFSTAHREKVIQYIYDRYGWERTGMVCNVVTFRPRMAIRQVGKALGFPAELIDRVARSVDRWFTEEIETSALQELRPAELGSDAWARYLSLCKQIQGFPRHLSIHVGGMLVTGEPLVDIVPVEPATMPGRVVVQFDKTDVEDLGLIKMDMLGLRTLSVVAECLELVQERTGEKPDLDRIPLDDPRVYETASAADTIGVFQIESRAQMQTLPRTRPQTFNDLVVEVAIIRPGPIQGNAVHPYIRRKQGREDVTYAHPLLEPILQDTLGVILYQEQIIEIGMRVAGFTPSESDRFRRVMSRNLTRAELDQLHADFNAGCAVNGVPQGVADDLFRAVEGFASFGFCRSHAAAFARTSYETTWLKLNYPAEYYCGLLNNQPMGFYHPSVLVEDAKRHGVTPLQVDVNLSAERCLPADADSFRIGFNYLRDLGEAGRLAIVEQRSAGGEYRSLEDFLDRLAGAPISPRAVRNLVMVGAFDALGEPRRELLWRWQERWGGHGLRRSLDAQPSLQLPAAAPELPQVGELEHTRLEYRLSEVSTGKHLIHFWRPVLEELGALDSRQAAASPDGRRVRVAGAVIVRQAPSTANKIRFFTLEDEFGHINVTLKPDVYERYRKVANQNSVLVIDGVMQRQDGVWSVLASHVEALRGQPPDTPQLSHNYR